ncbi:MAG: lipopolysaccharide biosynthesis protein [Pseudomonas helleri]|uniref:lipopolysaccharide biosynthesis protein n=1 Tax=Pseudomonas helleri TaxID=1608996 RepID=UPI003F95CCC3
MQIDDRLSKLFKNIFGSAAARLLNLLIALALVPLTINSLPPNEYAFLSIAISLSVLSNYADLGMGLAIVNILASESSSNNPQQSQKAISVVWFSLIILALLLLAITGVLALWVSSLEPADAVIRYNAMLLGTACILIGLPSGLIQRILFARHRNIEANIWTTLGKVLSLLFVWLTVESNNTSLSILIFGVIGVPVVISWLSVIIVFSRHDMRLLLPHIRHYDKKLLKPLILTGMSFLIIQMVPYFEVGIDTLLAGTLISIEVVPSLDVYTKLFMYVPALASIALFPLWPAIAQAKAAGDTDWILRVRRWAYFLVGATALTISASLFIYGDTIVLHWTHQDLSLPKSVITGMTFFAVLTCIGLVQSMILNGAGIIKEQANLYLAYLIIVLCAKLFSATTFGLPGLIWSLNACYIIRLYIAEKLLIKALTNKSATV